MTNLEKDQAIYNEMLQIANEVFSSATENNLGLRSYMNENGGVVSISEITKARSDVYDMINCVTKFDEYTKEGLRTVSVDTFKCSFPPMKVFDLLKYWKSLAKAKGDIIFTYEEEINRQFVGTAEISFENAANAKLLANSLANDELRPVLNDVLLEINATSGSINFVACNGHEMAVISNNPANIRKQNGDDDKVFQALFSKADWKRICDYARKQKSSVCFEIYKQGDDEWMETMVAVLGDTKVKSQQIGRYPNWKSVLPDRSTMRRYEIHPDEIQVLRKWQKSIDKSKCIHILNVSVYAGSDRMYFDYCDYDFDEKYSASFRMKQPSPISEGVGLSLLRFRTTPFNGICIQSHDLATYIVTDDFDLLLQMPMLRNDDNYVIDPEHREVHDCTKVENMATIVDMVAA